MAKLSLTGSPFSSSAPSKLQATGILYGQTGMLKTSLIFEHCPEPVCSINFDGGRDLQAKERADDLGREVYRAPIQMTEKIDSMEVEAAKRISQKYANEFWKAYEWAIDKGKRGEVGTIVIDTFEELKPILCGSICGRSEIAFKQNRAKGALNKLCRDIVFMAKQGKAHLMIVARETEIYVDDKGTGRYKPRVPPALLEVVDWAGYVKVETKKRGKDVEIIPRITMTKTGGNWLENGKVYTPDDWTDPETGEVDGPFAWICYNQWLKSKIEDWK